MILLRKGLANMGLRGRLLALLTGAVVAILGCAGAAIHNTQALQQHVHTVQNLKALADDVAYFKTANGDISGWQIGVAWDIRTKKSAAAAYGPQGYNREGYLKAAAELKQRLKTTHTGEMNDSERATFEELSAAYDAFFAADTQIEALYRSGAWEKADANINGGPSGQAYKKIIDASDKLNQSITARFDATIAGASDGSRQSILVVGGAALVSSLLLLGLGWSFSARLLAGLAAIRKTLAALGEGDLTIPAVASSKDELGHTTQLTEDVRLQLQTMIRDVQTAATSVEETSRWMAEAGQELHTQADRTAAELATAAATAQETEENVTTATAGAQQLMAAIQEVARSATDVSMVAAAAVESAHITTASMNQLQEASAEIGTFVKTISGIAQQTNLLALNATIEASRAGESGKGFAVVADEVKNLAGEAGGAAEDIARRIQAIQQETLRAAEIITEVSTTIEQISEKQSVIASAVEEQTAATNAIGQNVEHLGRSTGSMTQGMTRASAIAQEVNSSTDQMASAAGSLAGQAESLRRIAARFTLTASATSRAD